MILRYLKALLFVGVPFTFLGMGIIAVSMHVGSIYFWTGFTLVPGLWLAGHISDIDANTLSLEAIAVAVLVQLIYWFGLTAVFFKWQSWRTVR